MIPEMFDRVDAKLVSEQLFQCTRVDASELEDE